MIKRLTGQFPAWARRDHPVLRQELGTQEPLPWQTRYGRALLMLIVLGAALLVLIGWIVATRLNTQSAGENTVEQINAILYVPLLIAQIMLRITAFAWTSGTINEHMKRGTWDQMRATPNGTELTLRARWISLFYRLRGLFGVITMLRMLLIGLILFQLMSMQGRYLDTLALRVIPEMSSTVTILLVSVMMTAAVLLPFTGAGFDAALGLVVAAVARGRTALVLTQAAYAAVRIGIMAVVIALGGALLNGSFPASDPGAWLILLAWGALGDWGLAFLLLSRLGVVWGLVPYGIFLGAGLLIVALAQSLLADVIVKAAARWAQKRG